MGYDFNWDDLPQNPGDPLAGSSWTDVGGSAPSGDFDIPGADTGIWGDGLPESNTGGDIVKKVLAGLKNKTKGSTAADLSSVLGAFSSGEKANRVVQGNMTQGYDKLMLDAQGERNKNESDALKKLGQTSYIMDGGSKFKPATFQMNGQTRTAPDLGFGPAPTSEAEKAGASSLQSQLQARLSSGGSYVPQPLDDYAKPGLAENIGSYGGAAVGGIGALLNGFGGDEESGAAGSASGGQSGGDGVGSVISGLSKGAGTAGSIAGLLGKLGGHAGSAASGIGGLLSSKALPIAGAVTGAYGLAKNQSVGSDVMSGLGAGASIGSLVPGVGTAIGAGVGALVGALRGAFSVTGKEHGGRDAQAAVTANLSKLSTPQQQAEASKAGWPDPNQALSLIVMRDKLIQSGIPGPQAESQAEQIMHSMWDSEKSGSDAVGKAASPISRMMGPSYNPSTSLSASSFRPGTDAFSQGARG